MISMNSTINFILEYKWVILFYLTLLLIVVINRKKFQFQAKFIAMKRTKIGLKLMDKWGKKHNELIKLLGVIGIGIGFTGMAFIFVYVLSGFVDLFLIPDAPAVFSPVLPGVHIPGSAIFIPFWHGIIALFIVVALHEFGHGLVARANKVPVLSSGIVFFGPLIGAFVEPDEKKLEKESDIVKYSVFAAGPFANLIVGIIAIVLMMFIFNPAIDAMVTPTGFAFLSLEDGLPASQSGLIPETTYHILNEKNITNANEFMKELSFVKVNETITIGNSTHLYNLTTIASPGNPEKGYIGVMGIISSYDVNSPVPEFVVIIMVWISKLLMWIYILSLGLGAANLLPVGPLDGGQMIRLALSRIYGDKKGHIVWVKLGLILFIIILIMVFFPIIRSFF